MHNLLLVARREYLEQIRGRAFRVTTILVPALFGVVIFIMIAAGRGATSGKHIVVASNDAGLANEIRDQLVAHDQTETQVEVVATTGPNDHGTLVNRVRTGAIDGFLWVDTAPDKTPTAVYESQSSGDFITDERLSTALNHALVRRRLTAAGIRSGEIDSLLRDVDVDTLQINKQGREVKSNAMSSFWKGYVMAFLLSMTTMIYGMNVARSIIQEKASRIFEVMLATARPSDLLAGKLIGVGAVGLTQIAIWFVAAGAIASAFAAQIFAAKLSLHFSWAEGILFPAYFVLGYLLYASLFAGLAASCETEQELQMYTPLAALPIWLAFALIVVVVNNPDSTLSIAASLFPATAPIVMMLRMGSQIPPAWQFAASIAIMMLSIWAVLWVSSRLYRVGILMYGKRATFPELLRWLRYS
ncbi:MAG TPA: ABC transporter permease [Terracidiphilus sp.]|nr:ABC transporter permease [Terracidiphilus sp.]